MKRVLSAMIVFSTCAVLATGCSKKKSGVCYCKYLSGDKKEFDLRSLDRGRAQDSCNVLDNNARAFAGDCELK